MIKTFLDPELFRQGEIKSKLDIAKKMLLKGKDVKEIVEFTELTIKDVEALKEEVFQKLWKKSWSYLYNYYCNSSSFSF